MPIGPVTVTAVVTGKQVNIEVLADNMTKIVSVERLASGSAQGQGQFVRGSVDADATGGLWRGADYEAPQGVLLTYVAIGEDESDATQDTGQITTDVPVDYGGDYLMPVGRPELGTNVIVEMGGVDGLFRSVTQDVVPVLGRRDPVVIQHGRHMWESSFTFLTLGDAERRGFLNLIQFPSLMFVARSGFGFDEPVFLSPGDVTESRVVGLGSEPARRWDVSFTKTERPPTTYAAVLPSASWQERLDESLTWQGVLDGYQRWLDFAGFGLT